MSKYASVIAATILYAVLSAVPASAAVARDAIDLSQAVFHNSPNVSTWAKTSAVTQIVMQPEGGPDPGLQLQFASRATWPNYTPPGWDGPIQYTIWAGINLGGVWHVAGIIQMWRERVATGAPLLTVGPGCTVNNFACNWVYDGRWGAMAGYQPRAGEAMVFFATAGNARGPTTVTSVAERTNVVMVNLPANDTGVFNFPAVALQSAADFDGDGKTDLAVYRQSSGTWYSRDSSTGGLRATPWGWSTDIPVPGDYDGDGKADSAVFRPSTGMWYIRYSLTGGWVSYQWGWSTDKPVQGDYDGDGRTDIAVYRPSTGVWYIYIPVTGTWNAIQWGWPDDVPLTGDFDGDGRTDIAVFRPSNAGWYIRSTRTGAVTVLNWGWSTDQPVPGDYDGDGRTDIALFRASAATFFIISSSNGNGVAVQWGLPTDVPVVGDYDGDGRTDLALFRSSSATWYIGYAGSQTGTSVQWGWGSDMPVLAR